MDCRVIISKAGLWAALACFMILGAIDTETTASPNNVVRIYGSANMAGMVDVASKDFTLSRPNTSMTVVGGGTDSGFGALAENNCEIVMAARRISEREKLGLMEAGKKPVERQIGWDSIEFFVNPSASAGELTPGQLAKIFDGSITNWKDLGGSDMPIQVVSLEYPVYAIASWAKEELLGEASFSSGTKYFRSLKKMVEHVAKEKGAIGYAGHAAVKRFSVIAPGSEVKVLALRPNKDAAGVLASDTSIAGGAYPFPKRPLFLYWNELSASPLYEEFAQYLSREVR